MTDEQKTQAAERRAARRALQEAKAAAEKKDRALVLTALRAVLQDPEATTAQRLYAVAVLDNVLHYHLVPYGMEYPAGLDNDKIIADFARQLEAANKTT